MVDAVDDGGRVAMVAGDGRDAQAILVEQHAGLPGGGGDVGGLQRQWRREVARPRLDMM